MGKTDKMLSTNVLFFLAILKLSFAGPFKALLEIETEELRSHNGSARSGCPDWDELPKVWNSKFLGLRYYYGSGNEVPALSCNDGYFERENGFQYSSPEGYGTPMGTIFVHAGCTLYGFCDREYEGTVIKFEGPLFISKLPKDTFCGWHNGDVAILLSFIVDCKQHYPDCVPSDDWKTVASYDNSNSDLQATFTYKYMIGTSWSTEMSEDMSIAATVSVELSAAFFEIFEERIGFSVTTGYNWNEASTEAKSEAEEFSVQTDVPAGKSIQIQQTKGTCGGSEVNTEMFRTLIYDLEGNEHVSYSKMMSVKF